MHILLGGVFLKDVEYILAHRDTRNLDCFAISDAEMDITVRALYVGRNARLGGETMARCATTGEAGQSARSAVVAHGIISVAFAIAAPNARPAPETMDVFATCPW